MKRLGVFLLLTIALVPAAFTGKKKDKEPEQYCDLKIKVFKESSGKPLRNASVVLHPVSGNGKQEKGGLDLKTDENGEAVYNSVPYGILRIQVISPQLQTYGNDVAINQPQQELVIKMKPPQEQYSIYEHGATKAPNVDDDQKK